MSAFPPSLSRWLTRGLSALGVLGLLCGLLLAGCQRNPPAPHQGPTPANDTEAQALADFQQRINTYVDLHKRLESPLPKLPKEATPEQIDRNQRELGRLIQAARKDAKQGDLFTPAMEKLIREHFAIVFTAKDGENVKASVMDENPVGTKVSVNLRYPDEVPMSTMPPEVLQLLPKMPEELEYRFVGRHLVVMDVHAHVIADYVSNAIPE